MNKALKPSPLLLIKLGSAFVHAQEMIESKFKHLAFDVPAFNTIANDPEIAEWVKEMGPMLPRKRSAKENR